MRFVLIILILGGLVYGGYRYYQNSVNNLETSVIQIGGTKIQIEIARSATQKYQGLSDRDSLCANCGMLFVYDFPIEQTFSMRRMKFPLDFIFIREGRIVNIVSDVPPRKEKEQESERIIRSEGTADMVLEVNAGFAAINFMKIGDRVNLD